jgi:aminocarboxymuconate-semialdehyde decarboxylase
VIVVHGGGFLPYQAFRLDGLARAGLLAGTAMTVPPTEALRRLYFDTVALDPLSLELLVRRVGPGQVLLGSDAPFPIADPDPVGTVRAADLTDDDRHRICCGNAQALAGNG